MEQTKKITSLRLAFLGLVSIVVLVSYWRYSQQFGGPLNLLQFKNSQDFANALMPLGSTSRQYLDRPNFVFLVLIFLLITFAWHMVSSTYIKPSLYWSVALFCILFMFLTNVRYHEVRWLRPIYYLPVQYDYGFLLPKNHEANPADNLTAEAVPTRKSLNIPSATPQKNIAKWRVVRVDLWILLSVAIYILFRAINREQQIEQAQTSARLGSGATVLRNE